MFPLELWDFKSNCAAKNVIGDKPRECEEALEATRAKSVCHCAKYLLIAKEEKGRVSVGSVNKTLTSASHGNLASARPQH